MNAYVHSEISVKNRGGKIEDYIKLHDFSDCSKEVEASNRHRLYFHSMWGVKNVVMRIFGHTIKNSDGKITNVKDICENDHILPDYKGKFIPNLKDFTDCISDNESDKERILDFQSQISHLLENREIYNLMMSPLWNTGHIKSLLVTHNSWFVGQIIPQCFPVIINIMNFNLTPKDLFDRMSFEDWMQNGNSLPPSAEKLKTYRSERKTL